MSWLINDFIGMALNKGFIAVMVSRYLKHITSDLVHKDDYFHIITTLSNFNGGSHYPFVDWKPLNRYFCEN